MVSERPPQFQPLLFPEAFYLQAEIHDKVGCTATHAFPAKIGD